MTTEVKPIPYTRKVYYATYANLPITGVKVGDLGYATDRLVFYRWSGAAWQPVTIHSSSGTAANIPAAADLPEGSLYHETDTGLTKQVQTGAWATINTPSLQVATGSYVGNDADDRQITTGFKCSLVIIITTDSTRRGVLIPSATITDEQAGDNADDTASHYLHATDGFVVSKLGATNRLNLAATTYYYTALSE